MHLLFIDESGTPPKPGKAYPRYFVIGGIIMPEASWHGMRDGLLGLKARRNIRGELKWRYFAPDNEDAGNPMRGRDQEFRNSVREDVYKLIRSDKAVRTLAVVASASASYALGNINTPDALYHATYKPITERFQYHLQDVRRRTKQQEFGLVVADHRGRDDDKRLRGHHQKLLYASGEFITNYSNLVEGLFLAPSHQSVGIQLADMVAGAVWRKFERNDDKYYQMVEPSLRRNPAGNVDGHGIIKQPKAGWV